MNFLINLVGIPFGFIMRIIYTLVKNYGIAIILFTLVTKLILLPVSYKQQKNSARMQLINPKIKKLQQKYKDDPTKMQYETTKLYQDENINPYSSCLTSLIPLILLWGVLAVVYQPMTYILHTPKAVINDAKAIVISIADDQEATKKALDRSGLRSELVIMEKMMQNPEAFEAAVTEGYITQTNSEGVEEPVKLASEIDVQFLYDVENFADTFTIGSTKLSMTPKLNPAKDDADYASHKGDYTVFLWLLPFLSGLMQLVLTVYMQVMQKKRNPDMPSMGAMNIMLYGMPLFSIWLAFKVPAGVGFYWFCSSAFSLLQTVLLYAWFNEKRVEKIGEAERKKAKKSGRRPSMMQMMLEQQEEMMRQQNGGSAARLGGGPANRVRYSDDDGEVKLSRSEKEEYNTAVIREARRRIAEKYGDAEAAAAPDATENKKKKK